MGTWGTGPFDSDLAADFVDSPQGLTPQQVIERVERAFQRVTGSADRVEGGAGPRPLPPALSSQASCRAAPS